MEDAPVQEVLGHREREDDWAAVARGESVPEALERFHHSVRTGRPLDALVVTQNGRAAERPLGILTVYDVPRLHVVLGG
jgi:hypothetical protein